MARKRKAQEKDSTSSDTPKKVSLSVFGDASEFDNAFGSKKKGRVLKNVSVGGDEMDAHLIQVNIKTNTDKYYILKLIADTSSGKNSYFFYTRWGRTGTAGQISLQGPYSEQEAESEFKAKFLDKTGNNWDDRSNFKLKHDNYDYIKQQQTTSQPTFKWEYYVDDNIDGKVNGWYEYTEEAAKDVESLWCSFNSNASYAQRLVESGRYTYLVDLIQFTQANQSTGKVRYIRRVTSNGILNVSANAPPCMASSTSTSSATSSSIVIPQAYFGSIPSAGLSSNTITLLSGSTHYISNNTSANLAIPTTPARMGPVTAKPSPCPSITSTSSTIVRAVDSNCPLVHYPAADVLVVGDFDVTLNQVDIKSNKNKFYRLQLLKSGSRYHVWTRWGRVGEVGQNALLGPFDEIAGEKEFCSKFRDKTGNQWSQRGTFVTKTGKYDLIDMKASDEVSDTQSVISATPEKHLSSTMYRAIPPSIHPIETQKLISFILDTNMFRESMQSMNLDVQRMPLGTLSVAQIQRGFEILEAMKEVILVGANSNTVNTGKAVTATATATATKAVKGRGRKAAAESTATAPSSSVSSVVSSSSDTLADLETLSGRFYQTIPHSYARNQRPPVISTEQELEAKFDMLSTLKDIVTAQDILKTSDSESAKPMAMNPIDMKYNELHSDLTLLSPSHPHYTIIERYIENTQGQYYINQMNLLNIWVVKRHSEDASFSTFQSLDNHRLLWHGTNTAVVAAILKTGLRIMPSVNGGRVGRGIYMANEFSKSSGYVRSGVNSEGERIGILFLVEAALGKMHIIHNDDPSLTVAPTGFDSVLAKGTQHPDPVHDVSIQLDGSPLVSVPQGQPCPAAGVRHSSFNQDEFLVYRESQQRLRFILTFKYN